MHAILSAESPAKKAQESEMRLPKKMVTGELKHVARSCGQQGHLNPGLGRP
jgi:hypothetical protein